MNFKPYTPLDNSQLSKIIPYTDKPKEYLEAKFQQISHELSNKKE